MTAARMGAPMSRRTTRLYAMVAVLLLAFALRLTNWSQNRFLEDEALYAVWGLQIATGSDPMLHYEPVDKPPLYPYLLAFSTLCSGRPLPATASDKAVESAARLPSLVASMSGIALVYAIGRTLYRDTNTGLLAASLLALSSFDILFASTAFTDPTMVMFALASMLAAASARWGWAGLLLALTVATKQQGLYFLPLVVAVGLLRHRAPHKLRAGAYTQATGSRIAERAAVIAWKVWRRPWIRFVGGFALVAGAVLWWDASRLQRPGYLEQSLISYGKLEPVPVAAMLGRGHAWLRWLCYFWASPWAWALLAAVMTAWILGSTLQRRAGRALGQALVHPSAVDLVLALFAAAFLLLHWLVGFQIWDRYVLGLVPIFALLFARALRGLPPIVCQPRSVWACSVVLGLLLVVSTTGPALHATRGELPPGGDHGAYDGLEQLASFVRTRLPAGSVLYHFWLGYHYRFYLYGTPLRLHWYPDLADLVEDATVYRREPRYIGFPAWRGSEAVQKTLARAGIQLRPALETKRWDGTTSFRLFQLVGP